MVAHSYQWKHNCVGFEWMIDAVAHKEGQLNIESDSAYLPPSSRSLPSSNASLRLESDWILGVIAPPPKRCQDHAAKVANMLWMGLASLERDNEDTFPISHYGNILHVHKSLLPRAIRISSSVQNRCIYPEKISTNDLKNLPRNWLSDPPPHHRQPIRQSADPELPDTLDRAEGIK